MRHLLSLIGFGQKSAEERATSSIAYAIAMNSKQLITTDDAVIITPGIVLRHPTTNITEDGQNTYIRSVPPTFRTPPTPNQISASTTLDTSSPTKPPSAPATKPSCRQHCWLCQNCVKTPPIRGLGALLERRADSPSYCFLREVIRRGRAFEAGGRAPKAGALPGCATPRHESIIAECFSSVRNPVITHVRRPQRYNFTLTCKIPVMPWWLT